MNKVVMVKEDVKKELENRKIIPAESYSNVIKRLLANQSENQSHTSKTP